VVENFSGTHAAQERASCSRRPGWRRAKTQQAIDVLQRSAPKADKYFRAQSYVLLGAAYENALRPKEARDRLRTAAAAALSRSSGPSFSRRRAGLARAGDTAKALVAYRTIAERLDSTTAAGEAKVRLGD